MIGSQFWILPLIGTIVAWVWILGMVLLTWPR
jgi:hypothetical protein